MEIMKDCHDLYLKCDVFLLADLLEKFRNNSLKNYGLCPSHYLSVPGLGWDVMFKMTKTYLEPISDPDMYIFFKKGFLNIVKSYENYTMITLTCIHWNAYFGIE